MTLENAYKIGVKYGFTFNGIGPSLSMVDNKIGICVNVLDNNFGYIRRNFVFNNQAEFEEFLKKYSYYLHNKDKENLTLVLDNYEDSNPKIIYSNEQAKEAKKEIDIKNNELLVNDIRDFLKNFIGTLDQIRALLTEKVLVEQDYYNKLDYYQKLLYKAFDMTYEKNELKASKEIIDVFNNELKEFDLAHKRELSSLDLSILSIEDIKVFYDRYFNECKRFLADERWINALNDEIKFKNNTIILNKMIDYLISNPEKTDNTEQDLENIKKSENIEVSYDATKEEYNSKYLSKFNNVSKDYNEVIYNAPKIEYLDYNKQEKEKINKIIDLKDIFDSIDEKQKNSIQLIHSPLKPIILYVIEKAYFKNKSFDFDREEFVLIYNLMRDCFKNKDNLVFKEKYFSKVDLVSYENFIKSIVKIAKTICNSYTKLPCDLKLYSLNYDSCMISASDSNIKNGSDAIDIINAKEGCSYVYSPIKITYNKESNLLEIIPNENVIFFPRYLNSSKKESNTVKLNLYEEGYGIEKLKDVNLLIITKFDLDRTITYNYSTMIGKEK